MIRGMMILFKWAVGVEEEVSSAALITESRALKIVATMRTTTVMPLSNVGT